MITYSHVVIDPHRASSSSAAAVEKQALHKSTATPERHSSQSTHHGRAWRAGAGESVTRARSIALVSRIAGYALANAGAGPAAVPDSAGTAVITGGAIGLQRWKGEGVQA